MMSRKGDRVLWSLFQDKCDQEGHDNNKDTYIGGAVAEFYSSFEPAFLKVIGTEAEKYKSRGNGHKECNKLSCVHRCVLTH